MNDINQPLAEMFNLLSREGLLLATQISEERDESERLKMIHDLANVKIILSEITSKLLTTVEAARLQLGATMHTQPNHVSLSAPTQ